jgi:pimeloyl-ACP methyl ester carboxylesterase
LSRSDNQNHDQRQSKKRRQTKSLRSARINTIITSLPAAASHSGCRYVFIQIVAPQPSFYAVSTEDRTINPDLHRFMAKRMEAKTIEVPASHVSLISRPDDIAGLVLEAAGHTA